MKRVTASKLPMLAACPGAAALPWTESSSKYSQEGTSLHEFVAAALTTSHEEALAAAPESMRERCESIDLQAIVEIFGGEPDAEVAFAWDPENDAALEIGANLQRDYSAAPAGWVVGTVDLVAVVDDVAVVGDIKSGPQAVEHPSRHLQLRGNALAAARAYGCATARAVIVRIDEEGEQRIVSAEFDEFDLDAIAAELRGLLDRVEEAGRAIDLEDHLSPGEHCGYCPAFSRCPAQARTALAIIEDQSAEFTPELVAVAYQRLQAVESACKKVREAIRGYVARRRVLMPDGRQLRLERIEQDDVIASKALPILAEAYGPEVATAAASSSRSAIEEAVGKERKKAAIQLLREKGAIRKRPIDKLVIREALPADLDGDVIEPEYLPEPVAVAALPAPGPAPTPQPAPAPRRRAGRALI